MGGPLRSRRPHRQVTADLARAAPLLRRASYPIGTWFVRGKTNLIGVDIARNFPGSVGILIFERAAELVGAMYVHELRYRHDWYSGLSHYRGSAGRNPCDTLFLIDSLEGWDSQCEDFVALTQLIGDLP